jgi:endonuclease/exonuclease/phosphatase family metal-dependent hydrolase
MGLALVLPGAPSQAAPIRVTTWDLQPGAVAGTNGWSNKFQQNLVQEAAEGLKKLRPDVILLQQVADWETCHELAQALQPETYQVVICSSFRDPRAKLLSRQVAILSKAKAYLAWSEPWQNSSASPAAPGGFAFAAIRLGNKNIGLFSVQFSDGVSSGTDDSRGAEWQQARGESARQLVRRIALLQDWRNNRLQTFIVGGDFNTTPDDVRLVHEKTLSLLEQSGFDNALAGLPLEKRVTLPGDARRPAATLDYIFTRDAGLVGPALITQGALCEHEAVTCEMDLAAPKATPAPPPLAALKATPAPPLLAMSNVTPALPPLAASNATPALPPLAASKATPAPPPLAASNATPAPLPLAASNATPALPPLAASNASPAPPPLAARVDLPPVKPSANPTHRAPAPAALANATTATASPQTRLWLAGFLAAGLALFVLVRKLARRSELAPVPAAAPDLKGRTGASIAIPHADQIIVAPPAESLPYVHIEMEGSMQTQSQTWQPRPDAGGVTARMTEGVRAGVIANLSRWLKQKAVQRLVSDRARLLATQQAAGLAVLAVDQRLARIEHQIQQINQGYEQRIDDLLKELIATKEENRELISARIALVKAEMDKARLKAGPHAREHQQY